MKHMKGTEEVCCRLDLEKKRFTVTRDLCDTDLCVHKPTIFKDEAEINGQKKKKLLSKEMCAELIFSEWSTETTGEILKFHTV